MKRTILLLLTAGVLFFPGTYWIKSNYHDSIDKSIIDMEQRFIPSLAMTNMSSAQEYMKISKARFPDLVYGIVLDMENKPLFVANVSTPAIKEYLYSSPDINYYLQKLLQNPDEFLHIDFQKTIRHPEHGTFYLKPVQINRFRFVMVFLENSLKRRLLIFHSALGILTFFLIIMSLLSRKNKKTKIQKSKPPIPHKTMKQEERNPAKEFFEEKKNLEKQVEQLSLFREIALAINSTSDFNNMLKTLLDLLSTKYMDMNIIIYLNREDGQNTVFYPVYGLTGRIIRSQNELMDLGYKEYYEDDFDNLVENENPGKVILPLRDADLLFGGIIFEKTMDTHIEPDMQEMSFLSNQITMAIKNSYLHSLAITDGLSGLYVHRYFQIKLEEEIRRAYRYNKLFSLILMDIDHFKNVNDNYGHQVGDYVIKKVSSLVQETIRKTDLAFRYGGDEIVILLPETSMTDAFNIAEKLRHLIGTYGFTDGGTEFSLTSSMGIISWKRELTKEELIKKCDMALYQAKEEGRNRVIIAE